jgi:hypothetical protein
MSRIAKALESSPAKEVQAGGAFTEDEADRLNAAWRPAGFPSRAAFIGAATMDAVEAVENARGGKDVLLKAEAERKAAQKKNGSTATNQTAPSGASK